MEISFLIPGKAKGKERPRFVNGRAYTPGGTRDYEKTVRWYYINSTEAQSRKFPEKTPLEIHIEAVFAIPVSWNRAKRQQAIHGEILPTVKPDNDNIEKAICDALNDLAYHDDSQIVKSTVVKRYGERAFMVVRIREAEAMDFGGR